MADMSKSNLEKELNSYIRKEWRNLSFNHIDNLEGISELGLKLVNEYKGIGLYPFEGDIVFKLNTKNGYITDYYYIEGKVYIEESDKSPMLKINDNISTRKKYTFI